MSPGLRLPLGAAWRPPVPAARICSPLQRKPLSLLLSHQAAVRRGGGEAPQELCIDEDWITGGWCKPGVSGQETGQTQLSQEALCMCACVCMCVCTQVYACMCMCVCARESDTPDFLTVVPLTCCPPGGKIAPVTQASLGGRGPFCLTELLGVHTGLQGRLLQKWPSCPLARGKHWCVCACARACACVCMCVISHTKTSPGRCPGPAEPGGWRVCVHESESEGEAGCTRVCVTGTHVSEGGGQGHEE
uniref:Uncharacterized protein n=1 Tax=Myotis myotis TaxID=51298 RepID=A0A7J7UPB0_MYOMY|nr:hypothetical protein mMyoMyo1_008553 [Myotis myotis]